LFVTLLCFSYNNNNAVEMTMVVNISAAR